jgi:hypothetical protein
MGLKVPAVKLPVQFKDEAVTVFNVAVPLLCVRFAQVRVPDTLRVEVSVAAPDWVNVPVFEMDVAVTAFNAAVPALCVMFPDDTRVAPETAAEEVIPPVAVRELEVITPVVKKLQVMFAAVTSSVAYTLSAVTSPVKAVTPELAVTFVKTSEIGLPCTLRLLQLTLVADKSRTSRSRVSNSTFVGTSHALDPQLFILW